MSSRDNRISRRTFFFYGSLLAGAIPAAGCGGSSSTPSLTRLGYKSPNEKLNIASIGAGGRAEGDIRGCESENIVALCDVDENTLEANRIQVTASEIFVRHSSFPCPFQCSRQHSPFSSPCVTTQREWKKKSRRD